MLLLGGVDEFVDVVYIIWGKGEVDGFVDGYGFCVGDDYVVLC